MARKTSRPLSTTACLVYDRRRLPFPPEVEGRGRLDQPYHEFGLDVLAHVGSLRYGQHRSAAEIHAKLTGRSLPLPQKLPSGSPTRDVASAACRADGLAQ